MNNQHLIQPVFLIIFLLVIVVVSCIKLVVPRKYKKAVTILPLLLLLIPFVFGSGLSVYNTYISPIMAGLFFTMMSERFFEWFIFKLNSEKREDVLEDENMSILDSIMEKKKNKKVLYKESEDEDIKSKEIRLKEQEERERKRQERRKRRNKEK